jgi:RimJ/RimL family protein N-acetyltransferase
VLVRIGQEIQEVSRRLEPPNPPLGNERITLQPLAQKDRAASWAMVQDEDIQRFTYLPSTGADEAYIARWLARYESGWKDGSCAGFSIRDAASDDFLGFAAFVHLELADRQGEIGYMLAPAARGRGAALGAVELLTRWGFDELGLERVELRIDAENEASQRLAERAGYTLEGVLRSLAFKEGRRTDTGVWSRLPTDKLTS